MASSISLLTIPSPTKTQETMIDISINLIVMSINIISTLLILAIPSWAIPTPRLILKSFPEDLASGSPRHKFKGRYFEFGCFTAATQIYLGPIIWRETMSDILVDRSVSLSFKLTGPPLAYSRPLSSTRSSTFRLFMCQLTRFSHLYVGLFSKIWANGHFPT